MPERAAICRMAPLAQFHFWNKGDPSIYVWTQNMVPNRFIYEARVMLYGVNSRIPNCRNLSILTQHTGLRARQLLAPLRVPNTIDSFSLRHGGFPHTPLSGT